MAQKTVTTLIDDVDGGQADETVNFGLDGVMYEIDLKASNADALREALDQWIGAGRRVGGGSTRRTVGRGRVTELPDVRPGFTVQERRSMQKFARANDLPVPAERGRISVKVSSAWDEAGRPT